MRVRTRQRDKFEGESAGRPANATAARATPVDVFGRPIANSKGPIFHHRDGVSWSLSRQGLERVEEDVGSASSATTRAPLLTAADGSTSSYTLASFVARSVESWADAVAIGDVTNDGRPDVVLSTVLTGDEESVFHVFVFAQQANGTLALPKKYPYASRSNRNGIVLADLNEDCVLDVVIGHGTGISILLADGAGGLNRAQVVSGIDQLTLAASDVNRDGHVDIVGQSWSSGATIFYGNGRGGIQRSAAFPTTVVGYNDHEMLDVTHDGFADLVVMSGQGAMTANLWVHAHDGRGALAATGQNHSPNEWSGGLGLGDINGDGRNDAVVGVPSNSPTHLNVLHQSSAGSLGTPQPIDTYDIPEPIEVRDLEGDGDDDVVVLHGGWLRAGIYLQSNHALAAEALYEIPYATHYASQGLAVGDFSGDRCSDVAIADYNYGLVTLLGQCATAPPPRETPRCVPAGADGGADGSTDAGADADAASVDAASVDAASVDAASDSGGQATLDAGGDAMLDAAPPDAGISGNGGSAGRPSDAGGPGGADGGKRPRDDGSDDGGCACRIAPTQTQSAWWVASWFVAACGAGMRRRRRMK